MKQDQTTTGSEESTVDPWIKPGEGDEAAPLVLERLVGQAERTGSSDIHLQTHSSGAAGVAFRLDGVMAPAHELPPGIAERVFGRIKFLARLKTYQDSLPQEGRIEKAGLHTQNDIRVSTYPTVTGEKIVLRLFSSARIKSLGELGFPESIHRNLNQFLSQTSGLMLLTGPAGSGKTTTIYSCLRSLVEQGGRHVITIEDPVEQILPGVMQTEINEARGLDFAEAARHLLRQDPQVLVLGEIRDEQTANLAVRAALTGHLIIATLHAGSCQGVFERLYVLCPDHSAMASSIELVLNQRLLRRLCSDCRGKGCPKCLNTGYQGRVPIVEALRLNEPLRHYLYVRDVKPLKAKPSLAEHAQLLIESGATDGREVRRVLGCS